MQVLAHNAVHAAFAGFTGITVGLVNTHHVYLPVGKCSFTTLERQYYQYLMLTDERNGWMNNTGLEVCGIADSCRHPVPSAGA